MSNILYPALITYDDVTQFLQINEGMFDIVKKF